MLVGYGLCSLEAASMKLLNEELVRNPSKKLDKELGKLCHGMGIEQELLRNGIQASRSNKNPNQYNTMKLESGY